MTATWFVRVGALVAVGTLTADVIYATIPHSPGMSHGCYTKVTGIIRVVDDRVTTCKQGEPSLSTGPDGQQGVPAPKGDPRDSRILTVGTAGNGTANLLNVPDLGTVTAGCSATGEASAALTGAVVFEWAVATSPFAVSRFFNQTSWTSNAISETLWLKNVLGQWRLEYFAVPSGDATPNSCRVAIQVTRID
jgi:hypothetical protein